MSTNTATDPLLAGLSNAEIESLAAHFASLPLPLYLNTLEVVSLPAFAMTAWGRFCR
jgi:cytochrome c553